MFLQNCDVTLSSWKKFHLVLYFGWNSQYVPGLSFLNILPILKRIPYKLLSFSLFWFKIPPAFFNWVWPNNIGYPITKHWSLVNVETIMKGSPIKIYLGFQYNIAWTNLEGIFKNMMFLICSLVIHSPTPQPPSSTQAPTSPDPYTSSPTLLAPEL